MAIIKDVETSYGTIFNYHKIGDVKIIKTNDEIQLRITVESYLNKEARIEGKQPVITEAIILNADFALNPFYALLKAKFPEFEGIDDMDSFKTIQKPAEYYLQNGAKTLVHRTDQPVEDIQEEENIQEETND